MAYSSKSLTPTEQRYAQIEKECLAIVEAFNKFDQWLLGKSDITVHTDHQPLQSIFQKDLASAPKPLQKMMLFLQRYNFTVTYRNGSSLHLRPIRKASPRRADVITSHFNTSVAIRLPRHICIRAQTVFNHSGPLQ